ncbi:MAG: zinc-ribbon and DUF3426 domain-containing protein [Betaproteobacteria bacterium]|nr:zinc-ribbon and DUF3426 domain-containing protein [Betaproteobacteria bacterium]
MSLATRCPHCKTAFRLVRDQLLLSQGWVRCGRCGEAFNAAEHQFTFEPAPGSVDPSSQVSAVPAEDAPPLGHVPDGAYSNSPTPPSFTDPAPLAGLTSANAAAAPPRVLGTVPSITASPWQVGAFAYAPLTPKPPPVPASHDAKDEPIEEEATGAIGSIAAADLGLRPLAAEDDRDWLLEALAGEATALGLTLDGTIAKAPVANADAAIQPGGTVHNQEAQASPSSSPSAAQLLRAHPATEDDLATFSAEAEAALHGASPALAPATVDGGTAASSPQSPMEAALVQLPSPPVSAELPLGSNTEPGEDDLNTMHPHRMPLDTGHAQSQSPTSFDIAPDQELGEESRFDLGAALHYEFEPEPELEPELEPTLDADAQGSRRAEPAGNDSALAPARNEPVPRDEEDGHAPSASPASVLDVVPVTPLGEPQFLRQARARERWQRPAIRALLAVLSLLLVAAGATQAAWTWRDAIAARWPQTQPALARLCAMSGCTLAAPRRPQALVIDTSSMAPDAQGVLKLTASLRNRSAEPVAYPALELTLTDTQDRIVARKVIEPEDYLRPLPGKATAARQQILHGLAGGSELNIQLNLHLSKDQASGYTLYAFYP